MHAITQAQGWPVDGTQCYCTRWPPAGESALWLVQFFTAYITDCLCYTAMIIRVSGFIISLFITVANACHITSEKPHTATVHAHLHRFTSNHNTSHWYTMWTCIEQFSFMEAHLQHTVICLVYSSKTKRLPL